MIRLYEVRGTASHRNICDAGLHASEVVLYQEAKGPKLCPSLEQSIAQILSHNSQILEDLECERYIYIYMSIVCTKMQGVTILKCCVFGRR